MTAKEKERKLRALRSKYRRWLSKGVDIKFELAELGGELKIRSIRFIAPKVKP